MGTQTEDSELELTGGLLVFLSSVTREGASAQVTHACLTSVGTNTSVTENSGDPPQAPTTRSIATGSSERCSMFQGYDSICGTPEIVTDLCGVTINVFALLLSLITHLRVREVDVTLPNKLLIFLMKLKLGISFSSIGSLFGVHRTTASRIFHSILDVLSNATADWIFVPSVEAIRLSMPKCFSEHYPKCKFIIDCTEIRMETPDTPERQRAFFSNYKGCHTVKFLVAIAPNGAICFVSEGYGGRTTDSSVTVDSGFLEHISPGDQILADKGFPSIRTVVGEKNALLIMPPFYSGKQFTEAEMTDCYNIAQVRIHVERMIQRIKIYNILNHRVPVSLVPKLSAIFRMCCVLANLQPSIIRASGSEQKTDISTQ
ncbi:uncharacterized protein LOC135396400 [Ornithodoros turicata]|uniref:uncharacterized protein LOC135396400 n=1 Tax=Ornithodoros turicata TaxID=34597 RepID=UPI003139FDA2